MTTKQRRRKTQAFSTLVSLLALGTVSCGEEESDIEAPNVFQGEILVYSKDPDTVVHTIDDPSLPSVLLSKEGSRTNVGVYQVGTGVPAVTISDLNDDGVFDHITYSALSIDGMVRAVVEDYGMDGQPDLILDLSGESATVFYEGRWRDVDGVGSTNATVEIDGEPRKLSQLIDEIRDEKDQRR